MEKFKIFLCGFFTSHQQHKAPDGSWPCRCGLMKGNSHLLPALPRQRTAADHPARVG